VSTRTIASQSLEYPAIKVQLASAGVDWSSACHVTATGSLASALRHHGTPAIPIATLLDLITLPSWQSIGRGVELTDFPDLAELDITDELEFAESASLWRKGAESLKFRLEFDLSRALRAYAADTLHWSRDAKLLVATRREFFRSIQGLASAGFQPHELTFHNKFQQHALEAWDVLIGEVPNFSKVRNILWGSDQQAGVRSVRDALSHVFSLQLGRDRPATQVILHGFYFYTPPQWALFQLIDAAPSLEQVFLVHDDGKHPAFATWRQFFSQTEWRIPYIERPTGPSIPQIPRADTLDRALSGRPLLPANTSGITITKFRNVAEFAVSILHNAEQSLMYAPDHAAMDGYALRLGRPENNDAVDISDLPIGTYILNLHALVELRPGERPRIRIDQQALRDVVSSGYLPVGGLADDVSLSSVLNRSLPFFEGCDQGHEWVERALALSRLIRTEIGALGGRQSNISDQQRMADHAGNPLRTVPWADLTVDEADALHRCIEALVDAASKIAEIETVEMREYLGDLRSRLKAGMDHLSQDVSNKVLSKLESAGQLDEEEVSVDEVVEVVRLLLGRQVDKRSEVPDEDQTDKVERLDQDRREVSPLRDLDVLAYFPSAHPIHLANLSDNSFPRSAASVGWPFSLECISNDLPENLRISLQVMQAREWQAGLSDAYLLHLALSSRDPAGVSQPVQLSYIESLAGNPLNLSPLVELLTSPLRHAADQTVREYLGGLIPRRDDRGAMTTKMFPTVEGIHRNSDGSEVMTLDHRALATAVVCQRRFALQWALGPTASYRARHHFLMIFGNAIRALQSRAVPLDRAKEICDDLWRFTTRGQRASSEVRAWTYQQNALAWLATLGGSYSNSYGDAYNVAKEVAPVSSVSLLEARNGALLPVGVAEEEACRHCPVKDRCRDAAIS